MEFLDFIYKMHSTEEEGAIINPNHKVTVTDPKLISQIIMMMTMEGDQPIRLHFGRQIFNYHSYLKVNIREFQAADSLYLLIDALDPPIGNIRIRSSQFIDIQMFTKKYFLGFRVSYLDLVKKNLFKLSFPNELMVKREKRASIRVKTDSKWKISTLITREAGITFPVQLRDISVGGLCFDCKENIPKINKASTLTCQFEWKELDAPLTLSASVVEGFVEEDLCGYRGRFLFDSYDDSLRALERMVSAMQLKYLKRRKKYFKEW
ncbi:MAG: PilZ domain-containing protein [Magnetococcales bacterium]|nr:PilZ domain-containing protein [Magnetococcales bacterium]